MSRATKSNKSTESKGSAGVNVVSRRRQLTALLAGDLRALPVLVALAGLVILFASQSDVFLSSRNLSNLLVQLVVTGLMSLGLVFVLLLGEIDLSVASISGLCAVVMARMVVTLDLPAWIAILAPIILGALIGAFSGFWSTRFLVPTFVITLGLGLVLNGIQLMVLPTAGNISLLGSSVEWIANTFVTGVWSWVVLVVAIGLMLQLRTSEYRRRVRNGLEVSLAKSVMIPGAIFIVVTTGLVVALNLDQGIPLPVIIFAAFLALGSYVLNSTRYGLHVYATGGNTEAARRAGINTNRVKVAAFAIAGGLAAIAGIISASRLLGVSVSSGGGIGGGALLLNSIAATVIGGVSLFGGRGRASAALLGALIIGVVSNGLNLLGISTDVQLIVTGALLAGAVTLDRTIERVSGVS